MSKQAAAEEMHRLSDYTSFLEHERLSKHQKSNSVMGFYPQPYAAIVSGSHSTSPEFQRLSEYLNKKKKQVDPFTKGQQPPPKKQRKDTMSKYTVDNSVVHESNYREDPQILKNASGKLQEDSFLDMRLLEQIGPDSSMSRIQGHSKPPSKSFLRHSPLMQQQNSINRAQKMKMNASGRSFKQIDQTNSHHHRSS